MKRKRENIVYTWIVLLCFAAGQLMVFVHQHRVNSYAVTQKAPQNPDQKTITEKCQLCDVMHNNHMLLTPHFYFAPVTAVKHIYLKGDYAFISIALILSAGRSPPSVS